MSYPIHPIHQALFLQIIICFDQCSMVLLSSSLVISKISKNGSITGSPRKKFEFFTAESIFYSKSEKKL